MQRKKKNSVHLSLEFPIDEHSNLKIICARERKSIKDFVTECVIIAMKEHEKQVIKGIDQGLEEIKANQITYRYASEFEKYADE